jgi:SP family myo-inositol transporter-like MFS transporter 13
MASNLRRYNRLLLLVAGLGGLLYGIDVGVIAGALPYLEATSGLSPAQLSIIVAAVLLGSVIATLFAGVLADWLGRRSVMMISGGLFTVSIPIIAMSHGYTPLLLGRLLQGLSAGLIGVTVPLYLAECLTPSNRGRGTAVFQWMLTLGIVMAAAIGMYFSMRVAVVAAHHNAGELFAFKNEAWRGIFWATLTPGLLFFIGGFLIGESPRWLFRKGHLDRARAALLKSRDLMTAERELDEMQAGIEAERRAAAGGPRGQGGRESLLQRRYVVPFLLACVILACNQATGINSIIGYNATILIQAGLHDVQAHWGYLIFTVTNFLMTIAGVVLVDRVGRKRLLTIGSAGIIVSLLGTGILFGTVQRDGHHCARALRTMIRHQSLTLRFNQAMASRLLTESGFARSGTGPAPVTLTIIYSYGGFHSATSTVRSDSRPAALIRIRRTTGIPANRIIAFFTDPFANLTAARQAPLKIDQAWITPVPSQLHGVLTMLMLLIFIAFYAAGPGVCVWLALSELMPTRIRSSGMSIALLINQSVSTIIAALFLPTVGRYGYANVFYIFAGCTVVYFITAAFFLPETRRKTLEEIEELFHGGPSRQSTRDLD